jgi:hypothetical protein
MREDDITLLVHCRKLEVEAGVVVVLVAENDCVGVVPASHRIDRCVESHEGTDTGSFDQRELPGSSLMEGHDRNRTPWVQEDSNGVFLVVVE